MLICHFFLILLIYIYIYIYMGTQLISKLKSNWKSWKLEDESRPSRLQYCWDQPKYWEKSRRLAVTHPPVKDHQQTLKLAKSHCWRSRDELISDVLLWTPTHRRAKAGRPARTYIQQLCEDTGCCPEDLPEAMNDREKWRERVRDICATSTTWWWWWWWWCLCYGDISYHTPKMDSSNLKHILRA